MTIASPVSAVRTDVIVPAAEITVVPISNEIVKSFEIGFFSKFTEPLAKLACMGTGFDDKGTPKKGYL
jgi:hypothetical protein